MRDDVPRPRCECVVVWGYIYYTLFTLISEHRGTNREMCVFLWEAVTLILLIFETSQFINNAALAIRPDAIRRVLAGPDY